MIVPRTGGGPIIGYPRFAGRGQINGLDINGVEARVLLIVALGQSERNTVLQYYFDTASGIDWTLEIYKIGSVNILYSKVSLLFTFLGSCNCFRKLSCCYKKVFYLGIEYA